MIATNRPIRGVMALTRRTATETLQIVMADDDKNDQLMLMTAAEDAGLDADFTFVDDGAQLMAHLERRCRTDSLPNLIVLDLNMPLLDGFGTLEALQAHDHLWQVPVVVFTSSTRNGDMTSSFSRGARWFETKPSDFNELVALVSDFTQRAAPAPRVDLVDDNDGLRFYEMESEIHSDISWRDLPM